MSNVSNVIDSVSYDQYKNIPTVDEMGIKTKIIFNENAYLKLSTLIKKTELIPFKYRKQLILNESKVSK